MAGISIMAPFVATMIATASPYAQAEQVEVAAPSRESMNGGLLNRNYLTFTGATVPRPAVSQGPALQHRAIHDRDDHLRIRICGNC